jgi:two-component system cell cycle sensor histidine kinase/response regulator CckA
LLEGALDLFRQDVYLPTHSGKRGNLESALENKPLRGTETILLVEDHNGLRNAAQEMLRALGYRVLVASNGKMALEFFDRETDHIQLVIMDVVMPLLTGPETYLRMSALRPGTSVIFTTGHKPGGKSPAFYAGKRCHRHP